MNLTPKDKDFIHTFYMPLLKTYGPNNPASLSWNSPFNQFIRFKILCEIGDLSGKSILDIGCGLGDLYFFLEQNFKEFAYHGIDIIEEFIKGAKKKYGESLFECKDISNFEKDSFDYVIASGIFSFNLEGYLEKYTEIMKQAFNISRQGFAFNMLHSANHPVDQTFVAYEPEEISRICNKITRNSKLVQGYLPHDFTVYLYK